MSAYSQDRRDFLRVALAAGSHCFTPRFAWGLGSEGERAAWYCNAKFGMFIHWGPHSLASVEASWPIMTPTVGGITEAEYRELPKRFNPTKFNPQAFIDLARAAGQQYMVFTTKHHDGYLDYMQLQLTELLTAYGPVALIWFDGLHHQEKYGGIRFLDLIHRLQPATLVNDRIGLPGDYQTPEQFIPNGIPTKDVRFNAVDTSVQEKLKSAIPKPEDFQFWETCMTINNTWAYNSHDHQYKSAQKLIRSLVEVASRGRIFCSTWARSPMG